ncbi:MAG: FAD:protein FMN transferase [Bacteroidota bacterium]
MRSICAIFCLILWVGVMAQNPKRFEFSRPLMGTTFQIVLYTSDSVAAHRAAKEALDRVDTLNAIMSDYQSDSELNRLSATAGTGTRISVSDELWTVLTQATFFSRKTSGAFDVSIGPMSKLWRRAFRQKAFPAPEQIEHVRQLVGFRNIRLYPKTQQIKLKKKGMRLDLGGIAKGYAADQAYQVLSQRHHISRALVDAGGDLVLGKAPPGKKGWRIEIQVADKEEEKKQQLMLENCAIATSGDTYKYLEHAGKRYSHIIHPKTGLGMTDRRQVTVICRTGMDADAWASSLSVYPIQKISTKWFSANPDHLFAQISQYADPIARVYTFGTPPYIDP